MSVILQFQRIDSCQTQKTWVSKKSPLPDFLGSNPRRERRLRSASDAGFPLLPKKKRLQEACLAGVVAARNKIYAIHIFYLEIIKSPKIAHTNGLKESVFGGIFFRYILRN